MSYDVRGNVIRNNTLLNIEWSDGDMLSGKGTKHAIFSDDDRRNISFNKHKWLGGEVVVSYKGEIIYITMNGLKVNHSTAQAIKEAIKTGYTGSQGLLQD